MTEGSKSSFQVGVDGTVNACGGDPIQLDWEDSTRRNWCVELAQQRITLQSGDDVVELPSSSWAQDIYITAQPGGCIIRFETFDFGIVFTVSAEQAAPLLDYLSVSFRPRETQQTDDVEPARADTPLLWPQVSPLAIWALVSSALVFIPVLGLFPALVTVVLLVQHRLRVRRTRVWGHSRAVCTAATCFLTVGLLASALGTWGWMTLESAEQAPPDWEVGVLSDSDETQQAKATHTLGAGSSFFEQEHNWGLIAAGLIVVLLSLTVHEAGHAISAWWLGDDWARRVGRVTLNPMAHIDPFGTVLLPLILLMVGWGVFGWARPVPVRSEALRNPRRGHLLVSLAGPGANLLLAAAAMSLLLILGCTVALAYPNVEVADFATFSFTDSVSATGFALAPVFGAACTILKLTLIVNIFLAFFNLIPVPPLDGSWVLENLFPRTFRPLYDRIRPYGFMLFLGLIYTKVLTYLLFPAIVVIMVCLFVLDLCTLF